MAENEDTHSEYALLEVVGEDKALWEKLRPKLIAAINRLLESMTDGQGTPWFEEQARQFKTVLLSYAKSRLARPGVELDKTLAEMQKLYQEKERTRAEARRIHAQARSIELDNALKELRLALMMTKVVMAGDDGQEALLLGQRVDAFIEAANQLAGASGSDLALPEGRDYDE